MKRRKKSICRISAMFVIVSSLAALTGCGKANEKDVCTISKQPYEMVSYNIATVNTGDMQPVITLTLSIENYEKINYSMDKEDLEIDTVYVTVGQRVKKGDVLVSFKSDEIKDEISSYEEKKAANQMMIDHYTKLMKIDKNADYSNDIEMLKQDISVENIYIEEANEKLKKYSIVAEKDGTITYVSEYLANGYIVANANLLSEACGSGGYKAETSDNYDFKVGDVFSATAGVATYDMKISEITEGVDKVGNPIKIISFTPVSDMSSVSEQDQLTIEITKPIMKNSVYVNKEAILTVDNKTYVYVLDENGYRDYVEVKTGETINEYIIIKEGLSGGEQVTLN